MNTEKQSFDDMAEGLRLAAQRKEARDQPDEGPSWAFYFLVGVIGLALLFAVAQFIF